MDSLHNGYTVEVDNINKETWNNTLLNFSDAVFYQTWSYGVIHWGEKNLSHLALKKDGTTVAIAQIRIVKLPVLRAGIAYIFWGPVWQLKGEDKNTENLRHIIRALKNEYAVHRGYTLRVLPKEILGEDDDIRRIFEEEGFSWKPNHTRTIFLDLSPSLEEIRKNLHRSWKRSLKQAEKEKLTFDEGSGDKLSRQVVSINREMHDRKKYVEFVDTNEMIQISKDLPEPLKLKLMISNHENKPVAALGWSTFGTTGIPLVAGTADNALKLKASFLLWWKMVEFYKKHGFTRIDLAGINNDKNPGGHFFKTGLAGKEAKEARYLGQFDAYENHVSFILFKIGDSVRGNYRKIKEWFNALAHSKMQLKPSPTKKG